MRILRRVDIERSEEIFKKIGLYVDKLVEELDPYIVILFGSFARGDVNEGSDVDIIVVADFEEPFLDRIRRLLELDEFGMPLEPIGYTLDEFERMKRDGNPFILEVLEKGKVLYVKGATPWVFLKGISCAWPDASKPGEVRRGGSVQIPNRRQ